MTPSDAAGTDADTSTEADLVEPAGPSALHTRACELFGVRYPIVQTGMGWVSGANLTAATSAAGGIGILATITMTGEQFREAIASVKAKTDAPFGVNFRAGQPDLDDRIAHATAEGIRLFSFAGAPTKDAIAKIAEYIHSTFTENVNVIKVS